MNQAELNSSFKKTIQSLMMSSGRVRGRVIWLRLFSFLLIGSLLLSPAGTLPARAALPAPTLLAPADFSVLDVTNAPPLGIPQFSWAPVAGATQYRLQVAGASGFNAPILNITTANTTYTPINSTSFTDGPMSWRVRVESPAPIGDYSSEWSFTKQWAVAGNEPALVAPAEGATVTYTTPLTFSWSPVSGAARYKLQIYSGPGGWSSLVTPLVTTLTNNYQSTTKLANGTYYWRVIPVDPGNHDGMASDERSFTTDYNPPLTLLNPNPDVLTYPVFTPTFQWTAVPGAQYYRLQYSTDPSFASSVTQKDTRMTSYSPADTLPNDQNYYWRVRVFSGSSVTEWVTASQPFQKRWYIKPTLLTPTNGYQHTRFPIYSWTPVPGAAYYIVEIDTDANFAPPIYVISEKTANTFYNPVKYNGAHMTVYWRVTPYDGNDKKGMTSDTSSYVSYQESVAPSLVYPLYYYPPDTYTGFPGITTHPHEDRSVTSPVFIWNRTLKPIYDPDQGNVYADAYRLQVSTDPLFGTLDWTVDTENLTATPTQSNPFLLTLHVVYYWRVCGLVGPSPWVSCTSPWSQVWQTRFTEPDNDLTTAGSTPVLISPTDGFEFAELTPMLEWHRMSGATSYEVQISRETTFGSIAETAIVSFPGYAPTQALAQRSLGDVDFGIYYWRVRQAGGVWSETRRFQISAQSRWSPGRTLGNTANRLQIGSDPPADSADPDYELSNLQAAQDQGFWYIGFQTPALASKNVTYGLYLDLNHADGSLGGGTIDPRGYSVSTISAYRPEYALYVQQEGQSFSADQVLMYDWQLPAGVWGPAHTLASVGGYLYQNGGYVELKIPNTLIGYQDTTGSYAISLFSLPAGTPGSPQDSVPSDPNVPGTGVISRFANVTERMNLASPPNNGSSSPMLSSPSLLPFFWDYPILAPSGGAIMEIATDPGFSSKVTNYTQQSTGAYYVSSFHAWPTDLIGDNSLYWRVRPTYLYGTGIVANGAWSQGWRFEREGFVPENLHVSVTQATPTFMWDWDDTPGHLEARNVEGEMYYDLQVSSDPGFGGTLAVNVSPTRLNSYTPTTTLPNGTYYWRVRVHRFNPGAVINNWSVVQQFTLALPGPTGLTPIPPIVIGKAPTLCWTPLVLNSGSSDLFPNTPFFGAWRYRVQISKDPTFSIIYETVDNMEQSCWTPIKGYADDDSYYWRVAAIDGNSRLGNYSTIQSFAKQYPISTLLSPLSGGRLGTTPTFVWSSVNGAARYKLDVSLYANFSTIYDSVVTDSTRFTPTKVYPTNTYYWRLAIMDADGNIGPYNTATIILDPNPNRVFLPLLVK